MSHDMSHEKNITITFTFTANKYMLYSLVQYRLLCGVVLFFVLLTYFPTHLRSD